MTTHTQREKTDLNNKILKDFNRLHHQVFYVEETHKKQKIKQLLDTITRLWEQD